MDVYWSVIYSVAGIGAAALVALMAAAALVLGPWLAVKTTSQRRAAPARNVTPAPATTAR